MTNNIKIVGASAGTGKTTRLAKEFVDYVQQPAEAIDASTILVSTFTTKAAEELIGRIRAQLIKGGSPAAAQQVMTGYVGTVNSICGKILADYALEAGLSPVQNVIPENLFQTIFSVAVEPVFDLYTEQIEPIAARFGFDELPGPKRKFQDLPHWTHFVKQVCDLARSNRISVSQLSESATKSWDGLRKCLPDPLELTADELDAKLLSELERTIESLKASGDTTKTTQDQLKELIEIHRKSKYRLLKWSDWAALAAVKVAKNSNLMTVSLVNVANNHIKHPRLHADLKNFIELIFACAAEALDAYQNYKTSAGLMDFTDQECRALDLLEDPNVLESLSSRITIALIDEFQDTSPIQLALFLKFASIAKQSIWVGDIKQAIYGFRGADPELMMNAVKTFCDNNAEQLQVSYRSKKELVEFSNELFKRAFSRFGFPASAVEIQPARKETDESPVIELWNCEGRKLSTCYDSLASAVRELLRSGRTVYNKVSKTFEPLKGSDIAVLCRFNSRCEGVANALSQAGLKVAMTRNGLLDTPECILTLATLRYLIDRNDRFALATIIHLTRDYQTEKQSDWLTGWLNSNENPEGLLPFANELSDARLKLSACTAVEALQMAIASGHVLETAFSWGNIQQRSSNIDALKGLAIDYENACTMEQSAASATGFILYLDRLLESKQPPSEADDAIRVLTYHRSKGLEWPVVILTDTDVSNYPQVNKELSEVSVQSDQGEIEPDDPLKGRWLRFWPWPYGIRKQNVHLDQTISKSPEFEDTATLALAENLRLLYVGVTRARDLLCIAPYIGRYGQGNGLEWLQQLRDSDKRLLWNPPSDEGNTELKILDSSHNLFVRSYDSKTVLENSNLAVFKYSFGSRKKAEYPPLNVRPSQMVAPGSVDESTLPVIDIGFRIPFSGSPNMESLGKCIHQFFAADLPSLSNKERIEIAERLRKFYALTEIESKSLLQLSDKFAEFVSSQFAPSQNWLRECPLQGRIGNQKVRGVIDLLLETESGFSIFDHKSYPGPKESHVAKALSYAGQLTTYANVMSQASTKPVVGLYVHMPIVGKIVDLSSLLVMPNSIQS